MPAIACYLPDMRGLSREGIFKEDDLQIRVATGKGLAQSFGGVALAIILERAVFIENRLEVKRYDFLLTGIDDDGGQSRMMIRNFAVAMS